MSISGVYLLSLLAIKVLTQDVTSVIQPNNESSPSIILDMPPKNNQEDKEGLSIKIIL